MADLGPKGERSWLDVLRAAVARSTQRRVADRLGVSQTVICQVLRGSYRGRMEMVESRVRGTLMAATVDCPVLGRISTRRCEDEQRRPFSTSNPTRVRLFVTCRSCCHCHINQNQPTKGGR